MTVRAIWTRTPHDGDAQTVPALVLWRTSNQTRIRVLRQSLEIEERSVPPEQVRLASLNCLRQNSRLFAVLEHFAEDAVYGN
jgi:hypothetical protein